MFGRQFGTIHDVLLFAVDERDERVHVGHDARNKPQLTGLRSQKNLPVAPCFRRCGINRHARGDVGPEHAVQLVDGLLEVGFDLVRQRLGIVAGGFPLSAGQMGDADAEPFEIAGPVVVPGDDADAADGGGGRRVHPPGSRGEVVGCGRTQAVGVGVDRLGGLRGQPRRQLGHAGGHAAGRAKTQEQGRNAAGPGRGVLAVWGGGKHGVERRQRLGRYGPSALRHQLGNIRMKIRHLTAPWFLCPQTGRLRGDAA